MNWQRRTGAALMVAGALLLAGFLVPAVYGRAMAHLAVAQFRAQGHAQSLWDAARIRAYQHTLGVAMTPPEAVLRIPRLSIEVPVFEGTSGLVLNRGVGHIAGTALPGQPGNVSGNIVIAGHRDGFFRGLKDIAVGDRIELQRPGSGSLTDTYLVRNIAIVFPSDTSVLHSTDTSTLTLVTCYPFYYVGAAPQRYIVQATLLTSGSRRATS